MRMKTYLVEEHIETLDAYGQVSFSYKPLFTVDAFVSLKQQRPNETDVRYVDSTHIGITREKNIKIGWRLTEGSTKYIVKLVNNDGRMAQLTLQEVI